MGVQRRGSGVVLTQQGCHGGAKDLEDGDVCSVDGVQSERRAGDYHFHAGGRFPWNICVAQLVR